MENQDPRASRAAALSAARRRLARLKVASLAASVVAFSGLSAGIAIRTTSKVVASSSVSAASVSLAVASAAPTTTVPSAASVAPVPTAVASPVPAPTATPAKKAAAPIVSAQS